MTIPDDGQVRRASEPPDFNRFKVNASVIEDWEDAQRETIEGGRFEWWYFEARLTKSVDNMAAIVIAFLTKSFDGSTADLDPIVSVKVRFLDEDFSRGGESSYPKEQFLASNTNCDVVVGPNSVKRLEDGRYLLKFDRGDIRGTIEFEPSTPQARIGTGHLLFERDGSDQYLGWLVSLPHGTAKVDVVAGPRKLRGEGDCYHDHNWGDKPMAAAIHHWYWGRAEVAGFVVIAAALSPQRAFGAKDHVDLIVINGDKFLALGSEGAACDARLPAEPDESGKRIAEALTFSFANGENKYVAEFERLDELVRKTRGDALYIRWAALFKFKVFRDGNEIRTEQAVTSFEFMWFGEPADSMGFDLYTQVLGEP